MKHEQIVNNTQMEQNEFMKMRRMIKRIVGDYNKIMKKCSKSEKLHSETIGKYAYPFLHGSYTLAVVGKLSSGKSTFINTLIGVDLLPTGHFQTTSARTYIEHGNQAKMKVLYAGGEKKVYEGCDIIKKQLLNLVALPKEYEDLPINDINSLIIAEKDCSQILKKKDSIEKKTRCAKLSDDLWKKYIESHPRSTIAQEVCICYPLSEEFHGWKIVDTPGVGAIGGIQDATKRMLSSRGKDGNKLIDAIIFLQSGGDNIQDSANVEFVQNTSKQLTEEAKKRMFFVLTHATERKFRQNRDEIMNKINKIYGDEYKIPNKRLTYVDSLMARFQKDLVTKNIDATSINPEEDEPLEGWEKDACTNMYELIQPLKRELKEKKLPLNNENMLLLMEEWGHFKELKKIINDFVREVKESSFQKIISLISLDYSILLEEYEKEIRMLKGGRKEIENERESLKRQRIGYKDVLNNLRRLAATQPMLEKFKFIDDELQSLSPKKSIDEVRTTCQNTLDRALRVEEEYSSDLEEKFQSYCKEYNAKDITLRKIDFSALIDKAHKESTTEESVYRTETYKDGCPPKKKTRQVDTGYKRTKTDREQELRKFKASVVAEARPIVASFRAQLREKVELLCKYVETDINSKIKTSENKLSSLEDKLSDKEDEIKERISNMENIKKSKAKITKYERE